MGSGAAKTGHAGPLELTYEMSTAVLAKDDTWLRAVAARQAESREGTSTRPTEVHPLPVVILAVRAGTPTRAPDTRALDGESVLQSCPGVKRKA
jgi:hypothetical protein